MYIDHPCTGQGLDTASLDEFPSFKSTYNRNINDTHPPPNKIRVEYHPKSEKEPAHFPFYNFTSDRAADITDSQQLADTPVDEKPWRPFSSRLDFEIADLILETHMNSNQTDRLLSLIRKCISEPHTLTLVDDKDVKSTWDAARKTRTTEV